MSKLFDLLWDTRESLRKRGLGGTVRATRRRLFPPRVTPHPFDMTHGTDTGGLIPMSRNLNSSAEHGRDYWGTPPSMLRGALARWSATLPGTGYTPADYTFIDLGTGKGRPLMIASEIPFAGILGVELDPALVAVACHNLVLWAQTPHACNNLQVLNEDALAFPFPDGPVLLYLFNPFDAHVVGLLGQRITSLLPTRQHPLDIAYARPEHIQPFETQPGVQVLWKGEVPLSAEDTAADVFETTQQQCFIYRIPPAGLATPANLTIAL